VNSFTLIRAADFDQASAAVGDRAYALPILKAGGMDVLDHMKEGLLAPDALIDIRRLTHHGGVPGIQRLEGDGRIEIDATCTLAEVAASDIVLAHAPVLAASAGSAGTPQVRNVASVAGNLLQRPRCWYYRNQQFDCLKKGGDRCYAAEGENKHHAIFGRGPCYIVHPSNIAPALYVLEGRVHVTGGGRDEIEIAGLFQGPSEGVRDEHRLEQGEVVTHVSFRPEPSSGFYAIKEKQSFDWPSVFAAVALRLSGGRIESARVCAGAVAPVPWPLPGVERRLVGVRVDDDKALKAACEGAAQGAVPLAQNAYKVELLPVAVRRAVLVAADLSVEGDT
jgi:xanthine dehydrogenase YagS FAD-binding subunit